MKYNVKFSPPDITEEEINEVIDALKSGWITTGPKTKLFEEKIAEFCRTNKAVCLNSATACMELTLRLLGVGEGDEVITSAYTYTASCSVICHVGAKPIIIDTQKDSFEMDYDKLESAITEKTKAIIPVDLAGIMCDYKRIFEIVKNKKGLFKPKGLHKSRIQDHIGRIVVLADAAHAFGACQNGKMCGSVADFTAFSFHAVKNLTTAEGGAVTWKEINGISNDEIYNEYMLLSLHGQNKDALNKSKAGNWEYDIEIPGYKCNMTDIMASLGLAQLKRYWSLQKRRREIVEMYNKNLKNENLEPLNHINALNMSSMHLYMVRLLGKDEHFRNNIIQNMANDGISTNVHYKPLPMHTAYKNLGFNIFNYPNSFNLYKNEVTLPLHTMLTDEELEYTIKRFKYYLNN